MSNRQPAVCFQIKKNNRDADSYGEPQLTFTSVQRLSAVHLASTNKSEHRANAQLSYQLLPLCVQTEDANAVFMNHDQVTTV